MDEGKGIRNILFSPDGEDVQVREIRVPDRRMDADRAAESGRSMSTMANHISAESRMARQE
jgi:hypothetical protein